MKTPSIKFTLLISLGFIFNCCNNLNTSNQVVDEKKSSKVIILSIDGGGIKGILPAKFLASLEDSLKGKKAYQLFDVIGGTSTGGIISIGLTTPYNPDKSPRSAQEVLDFYLQYCDSIFYKNEQPTGPKYYADKKDLLDSHQYGIEVFLRSRLTDSITLSQASASLPNKKVKQVFTTTYLLNSKGGKIKDPEMNVDFGPYLFNWFDANKNKDHDYYLWEAARGTSAAPTYFPVAHVGGGGKWRSDAKEKWSIDGGMMSNDPAVWAVTEALRTGIASSLDDIVLVSIGCGLDRYNGGLEILDDAVNHQPYGQKYGFWGDTDWGLYLKNLNGDDTPNSVITETVLYANQFVPVSQMTVLAQNSGLEYVRIQFDLPSTLTAMDDCSNVSKLDSFVSNYLGSSEGSKVMNEVVSMIRNNL